MTSNFFTHNRRRLGEQLQPGSMAAFTAFVRMQGAADQPATFHQEANFWYLTGITEPGWRLVLDADTGEEWLIAPHISFVHHMFEGGLAPEEASRISGVKSVLTKREGSELIKKLRTKKKRAHTLLPQDLRFYGIVPNPAERRLVEILKPLELVDMRPALARMRAIKQPEELQAMQKAIDITLDSIEALLPKLHTMQHEYEVDALLTYEFRKRGAVHAFDPIVAAGKNTCVLHHPLPKDPIKQNDWLLLDIGAALDVYGADISRTIPIGKPSKRHLDVYQAVQHMHEYAASLLKAGQPVRDYFDRAYHYVGEELKSLGLIDKIKLDYTSVFKFMPHAVSHGLGVDTHDPLGRPEEFAENMTLTVEVGAYIPEEGIGVRLEDDMLITKDGAKNLSARVPIELAKLRKMLY